MRIERLRAIESSADAANCSWSESQRMARELIALRRVLDSTITQLNRWADESKSGGWSTHQVEPQQKLAAELRQVMDRAY